MAPAMPCKTMKKNCGSGASNKIKTKLVCILEADESTRMRMGNSIPSNHEDHIACARTLFKAKFLFGLVLNTLPAESETYNALVVMVCFGERSTQSRQRITERDTAQTERILTSLVITARPG